MKGIELNWQNVVDGNGIGISIVGVMAVFVGLFMIFLFISVLPHALKWTEVVFEKLGIQSGHGHSHGHAPGPKAKAAKPKTEVKSSDQPSSETDEELIAAIAYVIAAEAELEAMSDYTKLTIRRDDTQQIWGVAGRMRTLATRKIRTL